MIQAEILIEKATCLQLPSGSAKKRENKCGETLTIGDAR